MTAETAVDVKSLDVSQKTFQSRSFDERFERVRLV